MEKTIILKSRNTPAQFKLTFNADGVIQSYEATQCTTMQLSYFARHLPVKAEFVNEQNLRGLNLMIIEEQQDISFRAFWEAYNYKHKKVKAEQSWSKLSKEEKILALNYIQWYRQHCSMHNIAMAYPATFINQKYWDND